MALCLAGKRETSAGPSKITSLHLSDDVAYLLVGGLGGLGRSLTRFMLVRGAKHFALLSQSGTDEPEAARVVESIQARGDIALPRSSAWICRERMLCAA
ncbi:hypothetical protein AAE478_004036 [Parahypoxylon ruwenzoriense]